MKITITSREDVFGMANVNPKKSGLKVIMWSDNGGAGANRPHNEPRVKIGKNKSNSVSVSLEPNPRILAKSSHIKKSDWDDIDEGIKYVGRNYDLFLKHFNSSDLSYDDEDLFNDLRARGEYK